jgi:hypothetical protein
VANRKWSPNTTTRGTLVQSAIPTGVSKLMDAGGLTLRGVVVAVNTYGSDQTFNNSGDTGLPINAVYCDVLTYGRELNLITRVLYVTPRKGMHEGEIALPRAATLDTTKELDVSTSNPFNMDGDHVIVGFIENDLSQPYIAGFIPHPASDIGNASEVVGVRTRLKEADGSPRLTKHRGSYHGVDRHGNFVVDTRRAHSGAYQANGAEPAPALTGVNGNYVFDLPAGSTLTVRVANGATLLVDDKDGNATMTLGNGNRSVAVAQELQTLYTSLKSQFDAFNTQYVGHVHTSAAPGSPTTVTTPPASPITAPACEPNIVSDKLLIPST